VWRRGWDSLAGVSGRSDLKLRGIGRLRGVAGTAPALVRQVPQGRRARAFPDNLFWAYEVRSPTYPLAFFHPLARKDIMNKLTDKVGLITGAARGIGEAIARAFVREGAVVYLTDVKDVLGEQTASTLDAHYGHLDVREEDEWRAMTGWIVRAHGSLDIVVNNAGITGFEDGDLVHDPEHVSLDAWRAVHRTNLDGTFLGCKYAIRCMRPRRSGSIINISSRSGIVGIPSAAAYASSNVTGAEFNIDGGILAGASATPNVEEG